MTKFEELKKTSSALANVKAEDLKSMDAETIKQKQAEQLEKEKQENAKKVINVSLAHKVEFLDEY